jgi:hypothetical protein
MLWGLFPCAQRSKNGEMVDLTAIDAKNKDASCRKHLCEVQTESA